MVAVWSCRWENFTWSPGLYPQSGELLCSLPALIGQWGANLCSWMYRLGKLFPELQKQVRMAFLVSRFWIRKRMNKAHWLLDYWFIYCAKSKINLLLSMISKQCVKFNLFLFCHCFVFILSCWNKAFMSNQTLHVS